VADGPDAPRDGSAVHAAVRLGTGTMKGTIYTEPDVGRASAFNYLGPAVE
jgi:hypothetical protein